MVLVLLLLLRHGRGWLARSFFDNEIGPQGKNSKTNSLKTNSTLEKLMYVHWLWWVIMVGDLRLVWWCGAARGLVQCVWCV